MTNKKSSEQVTVIVRHSVLPGKEQIFEDWLVGINKACQSFSGFVGTETIKPMDSKESHYVCIFRFESFMALEKWMESDDRKEWLSKRSEFSSIDPEYEQYQHHGMQVLSGNSKSQAGKGIPPIKMVFLLMLGLALPVHFIPRIVASLIQTPAVITFTSLAIIVPMMVFLIMPMLIKLLGKWLF